MKLRSMVIILAGFLLVCLGWNSIEAGSKEVAKVEAATEVLTELMAIPEKGIAPSLLHNAYGVAVIPAVVKASFVVGGRYLRKGDRFIFQRSTTLLEHSEYDLHFPLSHHHPCARARSFRSALLS